MTEINQLKSLTRLNIINIIVYYWTEQYLTVYIMITTCDYFTDQALSTKYYRNYEYYLLFD